uniref:Uncharacterized protein n=1 Tax=Romanomermis culicivorax TaxID=13658 RepID=A0A915IDH5_ROMCU
MCLQREALKKLLFSTRVAHNSPIISHKIEHKISRPIKARLTAQSRDLCLIGVANGTISVSPSFMCRIKIKVSCKCLSDPVISMPKLKPKCDRGSKSVSDC